MTLETDLSAACAATRGLFGAAACSCALVTEAGDGLEFVAASGRGAAEIVGVRLPLDRGIAGFVAGSGQPVAIGDVASDRRFARDLAEATSYVPTAMLAAPLLDEYGDALGVMEVLDPAAPDDGVRIGTHQGTAAELTTLAVVASQVAVTVGLWRRTAALAGPGTDASLLDALGGVQRAGPAVTRAARDVLTALARLEDR